MSRRAVANAETGRTILACKDFDQCIASARGGGNVDLASRALGKKGRMLEKLAAAKGTSTAERTRLLGDAKAVFEAGGEGGGCMEGATRVKKRMEVLSLPPPPPLGPKRTNL